MAKPNKRPDSLIKNVISSTLSKNSWNCVSFARYIIANIKGTRKLFKQYFENGLLKVPKKENLKLLRI